MIDSESEGNAVASRPAAAQCQWHSGLQPSESNLNPGPSGWLRRRASGSEPRSLRLAGGVKVTRTVTVTLTEAQPESPDTGTGTPGSP
eukprot:3261524-Rhodomonas_salina.1